MAQNQDVKIKATVSVDSQGVDVYNKKLDETAKKTEKAFNPKQQLREANLELIRAQEQFGQFSQEALQAAKRVADLKDAIGDARGAADLFNPEKKFQVFAGALSDVSAAYGGLQGALGLFGVESKKVEEQLLKVQSAMALAEGFSAIGRAKESFSALAAVVKSNVVAAFQALKAAIGSTGIGLLVIALGAIAANWDRIKASITGVSKEQERLNAESKKNFDIAVKKVDALNKQDNILKLQGKTEREILQLKIAETKQAIEKGKIEIKNSIVTLKAQVEAEKRNKAILKGILDFINAPVEIILTAVREIAKLVGVDFNFSASEFAASFIFDPAEVEANGQAAIEAQQQALKDLENNQAGFELQIKEINKKGSESANKDAQARREAELNAQQELIKAKQQNELNAIKDEDERRKRALDIELANEKDRISKLQNVSEATRKQLLAEVETRVQTEKDKIDEARRLREEKAEKDFQKQLAEAREQNRLSAIQDEDQKAIETIKASYQKQIAETLANEQLKEDQRKLLASEIEAKRDAELAAKQKEIDIKNANKALADFDKQLADQQFTFDQQRANLDARQKLLDEFYAAGKLSDEDYTKQTKENSDKRKKIDEAETASKIENAQKISGLLGNLSNLFGKQTAAGKAAAIAQTTIDTYLGAQKAYQSLAGIPVVGPALGVAAAAAAVASGLKNVKEIVKVQTPGGQGSTGTPNINSNFQTAAAPIAPQAPQAQTATLDQQSINQLGNVTARAYVVESDVSNSQERINRINRAARFG